MRLAPRLRRLRRPAAFWALAGASQLVAHDVVFLVQLGPGEPLARALRGGGHAYWQAASMVLLALATLAAAGVAARLLALRRRVRDVGVDRIAGPSAPVPIASRRHLALQLWIRLFAILVIGFTVQENVEHVAGHAHAIGLAALHGPEYPLALPVLAAVSLVAALVAALVLGVERRLVAAIAALSRRGMARASRRGYRPSSTIALPRPAPLASLGAGRAPPTRLVAST